MAQILKNGRCRRPIDFILSRTTRILLSNQGWYSTLISRLVSHSRLEHAGGPCCVLPSRTRTKPRRTSRHFLVRLGRGPISVLSAFSALFFLALLALLL